MPLQQARGPTASATCEMGKEDSGDFHFTGTKYPPKQQSSSLYDYPRDYTTGLTASVGANGFATLPDAKGVTARL